MREILTDKNYITGKVIILAKLLLVLSLVIFFAPLFILPFFNHPGADDYICGYYLNNRNFWEYQSFIYNNWGGRFAATFAGSLFAKGNFLYNHYWLHSLLLLILNITSVFFMLIVINKHILKDEWLKRNIALSGMLFFALQVCSLVEISTYIFWFSSAITYQLPVLLLQFQVGFWILLLHTAKSFLRLITFLVLPVLIFIINGFNELFIVVQAVLLLFVLLAGTRSRLPVVFVAVTVMAFVVSTFIVLRSPGIYLRADLINSKGLLTGMVAVAFHVSETLWSICKSPFSWLAIALAFLYGNDNRERFKQLNWVKTFHRKLWLMPVSIFLFLIASVGIAVAGLKGGIIPDRYVNGVICIALGWMLFYAFITGTVCRSLQVDLFSQNAKLLIPVLCFFALLGNAYIKDAYKNIISAPLYDTIMDEREAALKEAAMKGHRASLKSYNHALEEQLNKNYSNSTQTLYNLVQQKPSFLFFEDDLSTEYSIGTLRNFYKVDDIIVK